MLSLRSFSFVAMAFSFVAVGLGASPAQAAICCSAPKCQSENPPPLCDSCTPTCADDEMAPAVGQIVYDEVESLCYVAGDLDPAASEGGGCE